MGRKPKYKTEDERKAARRNVTRESVRKWTKSNPDKVRARRKLKHPSVLYPVQYSARNKIRDAIKLGKILRPSTCQNCGISCKPQGHHHDYSQPLNVVWLCRTCHESVHHDGLTVKPKTDQLNLFYQEMNQAYEPNGQGQYEQ